MLKRLLVIAFLVLTAGFLLLPEPANAYNLDLDPPLGYLIHWYSDKNHIFRPRSSQPTISYGVYNTFNETDFYNYYDHGRRQWHLGGLKNTHVTSLSSAEIQVFGGSHYQLKGLFPEMNSSHLGMVKYTSYELEGSWQVINGSAVNGFTLKPGGKIIVGIVKVPASSELELHYYRVMLHELGHAFGWIGHSSEKSDIMYHSLKYAQVRTVLNYRDIHHVLQVKR